MNCDYKKLEDTIGYQFKDKQYMLIALTHSSFSNEMRINRCPDYERQEFLGDAVLEMVSSQFIYLNHPEMSEGNMTKLRASLVCEPALAYCARQFGLPEYIRLGKGEEATGGRNRDSIVSDVLEALIGGIFLDGGIEPAKIFIDKYILDGSEERLQFFDAKSGLQQRVQAEGGTLEYVLLSENGPDHNKEFVMQAVINSQPVAIGKGHTKKAAEQAAAFEALRSKR